MLKKLTSLALSLSAISAMTALSAIANEQSYQGVVFFGDSLSDGGYFRPALASQGVDVTAVGTFTTNPDVVWSSHLANQLGHQAVPNIPYAKQSGNNYAIGGARAGVDLVREGLPITAVSKQVDTHLATQAVNGNHLYAVWVGANDLFAAAEAIKKGDANAQAIVLAAANDTAKSVAKLHKAGAGYILVPNIPDVGLTPDFVGTPLAAQGTQAAATYNQLLFNQLTTTGANVIALDTFGLLQQVAKNPSAYGFDNMTQKACGEVSSLLCHPQAWVDKTANKRYFFADGVHPTGRAHRMIADYAQAVVHAPSQMGMVPRMITKLQGVHLANLQRHIDEAQTYAQGKTHRAWVVGGVDKSRNLGVYSDGDGSLLAGVDFLHGSPSLGATGAYVSYRQSAQDKMSEQSSGLNSLDQTATGMGAYHILTLNQALLSAGVGLNWLNVDTVRQVVLDDWRTQHQATTTGKFAHVHAKLAYPWTFAKTTLMPYVGVSANRLRLDRLSEATSGATAMSFDEQNYASTQGKFGANITHDLPTNAKWQLFGDVYYQTLLSQKQDDVTAGLNNMPSVRFTTPLSKDNADGFGASIGVRGQLGHAQAKLGISHQKLGDDDNTGVIFGINQTF